MCLEACSSQGRAGQGGGPGLGGSAASGNKGAAVGGVREGVHVWHLVDISFRNFLTLPEARSSSRQFSSDRFLLVDVPQADPCFSRSGPASGSAC